jgi:hypothetical protein
MASYFGQSAAPPGAHNSLNVNMLNLLPAPTLTVAAHRSQPGRIVIEEILRLESSLHRYRVMTSDVELSGVRIPPGTSSSSVLDWDPAELTDPDEFGPGRGLRNECHVWHGHPLVFGRLALGRDEAARESERFLGRVQGSVQERITPESRPPYIFPDVLPEYGPRTSDGAVGQTVGPEE